MDCLGRYVDLVFFGTFKEVRYDTKNNPHLAKVLEKRPDILDKWKQEEKVNFAEIHSEGMAKDVFNIKAWLRTKLIVHKHLGEENLSYFEKYLNAESDEIRKSISSELKQEWEKNVEGKKKQEVNQSPILLNLKFQMECIKLIKVGTVENIKMLKNNFQEIGKIILTSQYKNSEFANDVNGFIESIEMKKETVDESHYQAIITDDPIDLLLCGTDVAGSCQRLDGGANLNKGLLGYLMDGKNRLLVIKEKNEKIVARCMLKLLWDGEQPVLYREDFYPDTLTKLQRDALEHLAKKLSVKLNVPLTNSSEGAPYGRKLHSLGGPAPYEYTDGGGGVQKNGIYTIEGAKQIL
ncbi:MAG: hypothetical protein H0W50_00160 [Parachlamydiaceae bacterium]|nr:hypothetical protein [Parachlamydiaceae bacterium]